MPETAQPTASVAEHQSEDPGVTGQAQDKAKEVASQAHDRAREAAGQARGRVRVQVDTRSTQLGERVSAGVGDARSVSEELRRQGKDAPASAVEQAADRADRLGTYLKDSDGDKLLRDVEDFGRRNPWALAAGGLLLGFAASRMLKASSGERYHSSRTDEGARGLVEPSGSGQLGDGVGHGTRPSQFEPHR
jgi:hypothetical protein